MSSTFKGLDLFNSGPHRFSQEPVGFLVMPTMRVFPGPTPGSTLIGELETAVLVTGRLVAPTEEELWSQRDNIGLELAWPPTPGTLVEHSGRSWENMTFVEFAPGDRTDRGRLHSLSYTARFLRFLIPPTP